MRILERGGRVRPLLNHAMGGIEVGPARVWLQDVDVPGLAMSRSLGDYVAQSVGVSPEPGKYIWLLFIKLYSPFFRNKCIRYNS